MTSWCKFGWRRLKELRTMLKESKCEYIEHEREKKGAIKNVEFCKLDVKFCHENVRIIRHAWFYRAKDAKTREYFEKVFPEIKKNREDKERFSRLII